MKRLIYLIIIFVASGIWFSSCGSHKSAMKQETQIEENSTHQRKDTSSVSQQVEKTEHEDVTETIEEVTTVYDTSKSVDPNTGKPPLLSESRKNTRKETGRKKQENVSTQANSTTKEQTSNEKKASDKKEEVKQKDETTVPKQIGGIVWALVGLVVASIIGRILYKKFK